MQELYKKLKEFGHTRLNESLSKHTTFKIGGPADFFIEVDNNKKLIELLNFLSGEGLEYFILGGGSNMLFSDEGFRGVVIRVKSLALELQSPDIIVAEAGVLLSQVVSLSLQNNLSGMEWGVGIPGTVGGAVRGNAGAMGKDVAQTLQKVEVWQDGEIKELTKEECTFSYRGSIFKHRGGTILRAYFKLNLGDKKQIMEATQVYLKQRNGRYPTAPNAGSFFKNIDVKDWPGNIEELPELFRQRGKVPVGWLVEQVDMKGYSVGGAKISDEHGNFIVNINNATQDDILTIVERLKEKIYNTFKVNLEPEVEIIS